MTPTLIAWSQGTSTDAGRETIRALVAQLGTLLPGVRIEEAFAVLHEPSLATAVAAAVAEGPAVVVPLMLSTGVQTRADIASAVGAHPGLAFAAPALGPHDLLALVLESRLLELGIDGDDAVVLAADGECNPDAALDVERMASRLALCLHAPVSAGFTSGNERTIGDEIAYARAAGARRVVVARYVLAPGNVAEVLAVAGADAVTAPLAPDLRVAALAAQRYRDAAALLAASVTS